MEHLRGHIRQVVIFAWLMGIFLESINTLSETHFILMDMFLVLLKTQEVIRVNTTEIGPSLILSLLKNSATQNKPYYFN